VEDATFKIIAATRTSKKHGSYCRRHTEELTK